jgi:hypothetical protein
MSLPCLCLADVKLLSLQKDIIQYESDDELERSDSEYLPAPLPEEEPQVVEELQEEREVQEPVAEHNLEALVNENLVPSMSLSLTS